MKPHEEHRQGARATLSLRIVTVSSSRFQMKKGGKVFTDESGDAAVQIAGDAGHTIAARKLLPDDMRMIASEVEEFLRSKEDVLVVTGGTGVSPSDVTIEAVRPLLDKELEGFGELLRRVGYDEIGPAALLSRATAGVSRGKLILCLPGSPGAVRTALKSTIGEFPHILRIARE